MVKSIHFICPGGGIRGCFQAGFLYELFTKYKNFFEIYRIDGTSVGSINGFITLLGEYEKLKENWLNIKNINDFFGNWSNTPFINRLSNFYYGFYNSGLYDNSVLKNKITNITKKKLENIDKKILDKFSCPVVCINDSKLYYINGSNVNIINYITASASPWCLTNPVEINNKLYTDGSLLETYPIKHINKDADITLIVGFDQEIINFEEPKCDNLINLLLTMIDITRVNSQNTEKILEYIKKGTCIPVMNTMNCLFTDFNEDIINIGFNQGKEAAEVFYRTYLQLLIKN